MKNLAQAFLCLVIYLALIITGGDRIYGAGEIEFKHELEIEGTDNRCAEYALELVQPFTSPAFGPSSWKMGLEFTEIGGTGISPARDSLLLTGFYAGLDTKRLELFLGDSTLSTGRYGYGGHLKGIAIGSRFPDSNASVCALWGTKADSWDVLGNGSVKDDTWSFLSGRVDIAPTSTWETGLGWLLGQCQQQTNLILLTNHELDLQNTRLETDLAISNPQPGLTGSDTIPFGTAWRSVFKYRQNPTYFRLSVERIDPHYHNAARKITTDRQRFEIYVSHRFNKKVMLKSKYRTYWDFVNQTGPWTRTITRHPEFTLIISDLPAFPTLTVSTRQALDRKLKLDATINRLTHTAYLRMEGNPLRWLQTDVQVNQQTKWDYAGSSIDMKHELKIELSGCPDCLSGSLQPGITYKYSRHRSIMAEGVASHEKPVAEQSLMLELQSALTPTVKLDLAFQHMFGTTPEIKLKVGVTITTDYNG